MIIYYLYEAIIFPQNNSINKYFKINILKYWIFIKYVGIVSNF